MGLQVRFYFINFILFDVVQGLGSFFKGRYGFVELSLGFISNHLDFELFPIDQFGLLLDYVFDFGGFKSVDSELFQKLFSFSGLLCKFWFQNGHIALEFRHNLVGSIQLFQTER